VNRYVGSISEFQLEPDGRHAPRITCPPKAIPAPGQYLLAYSPSDPSALFGAALTPQVILPDGFIAAPPVPAGWSLATPLELRGPLGKGFHPPGLVRNLALAAFGDTAARLLPLIPAAQNIALFTDLPTPRLPAHIEIQPLAALADALPWADFTALDLPLEAIPQLATLPRTGRPIQALITTPMPCGSLADCGVCAVKAARGYKLACKDGPVFGMNELAF